MKNQRFNLLCKLTPREKQILSELATGKTCKTISIDLNISRFTVETHIKKIYLKLKVKTRGSAVAKAIIENLV